MLQIALVYKEEISLPMVNRIIACSHVVVAKLEFIVLGAISWRCYSEMK